MATLQSLLSVRVPLKTRFGVRWITLDRLQAEQAQRRDREDLALGRKVRAQMEKRARKKADVHGGRLVARDAKIVAAARYFLATRTEGGTISAAVRYLRQNKRQIVGKLSVHRLRRIISSGLSSPTT